MAGDPGETTFGRWARRRRGRLSEDFRRSARSSTPTWAYAVGVLAMLAAIAVFVLLAQRAGSV